MMATAAVVVLETAYAGDRERDDRDGPHGCTFRRNIDVSFPFGAAARQPCVCQVARASVKPRDRGTPFCTVPVTKFPTNDRGAGKGG